MDGGKGKIFQYPDKDEHGKIGYGDPGEVLQERKELVSHGRAFFYSIVTSMISPRISFFGKGMLSCE